MKRTKFYVCPQCSSLMQGSGNCQVICCGKQLKPLKPLTAQDEHQLTITEIEDDFYVELNHEMTKEHYISFISFVRFDRVMTVKLYPEQDPSVRIPRMYGGEFYYYCTTHGLYKQQLPPRKRK